MDVAVGVNVGVTLGVEVGVGVEAVGEGAADHWTTRVGGFGPPSVD